MYSRTEALIGNENLKKLNKAKVLIIGIGGVGGSAVTSLVRSGVENIIIVDNDIVDISNINRQIVANTNTIGKKKVYVASEYLTSINPNLKITIVDEFINKDNIDKLFMFDFDYVIDACDTIDTKKLIIKKSLYSKKTIISCMGTAKKLDPGKLCITYLNKTEYDPLAKILRKWAKKEGIKQKISVVSSTELPIKTNNNVLASMCFVPNIAGILCSKYIVDKIINNNI